MKHLKTCLILSLLSANNPDNYGQSKIKDAPASREEPIQVLVRSSNLADPGGYVAEMKFVFCRDYIFYYQPLVLNKKRINLKTRETSESSDTSFQLLVNRKGSNAVYLVKHPFNDSIISMPDKQPVIGRSILGYVMTTDFNKRDAKPNKNIDSIILRDTVYIPSTGYTCIYSTYLKRTQQAEIANYLLNPVEAKLSSRIVQINMSAVGYEKYASVARLVYSEASAAQKNELHKIIAKIK